MKNIRRDTLKRKIAAGQFEAKCAFHYTDDYAYDNATSFGKTGWLPARIKHPRYERDTNPIGNWYDRCVDHDIKDGYINFDDGDFASSSGRAYRQEDKITLVIHSNLVYSLREINA